MKKMTKQDLKNYIISEAKKLYKIEVLKEEKKRIDKELKMLSENGYQGFDIYKKDSDSTSNYESNSGDDSKYTWKNVGGFGIDMVGDFVEYKGRYYKVFGNGQIDDEDGEPYYSAYLKDVENGDKIEVDIRDITKINPNDKGIEWREDNEDNFGDEVSDIENKYNVNSKYDDYFAESKIKKTGIVKEDYTLQYADRPTANSPIVKLGYNQHNLLYRYGFDVTDNEEITLNEFITAINRTYNNLKKEMSDMRNLPDDFKSEMDLLKQLSNFAKQSKRDNNQVVMITSDLSHDEKAWHDRMETDYDNSLDEDAYNDEVNKQSAEYKRGYDDGYRRGLLIGRL